MKKTAVVLILALAVAGAAVAQGAPAPWGPPGWNLSQTPAQSIKVEGKLALINGIIGLKSGSKTYYVPMLARLAGFVEGIKEGASVKLEGYEYPYAAAPEYSMLMVTKLTVGGKDYDLGQFAGRGMGGRMHDGRYGGMRGGRGW